MRRWQRLGGTWACVAFLALTACSGGGGSGGSAISSSPSGGSGGTTTSSGPTWTPGVYEPASDFIAQCENPRSGFDIEGNAFPDEPGSTTIENFWLRSWTNETYLWNDEVPDLNPASFSNRVDYFNRLKTSAVEPSGEDRDDFHFSQSTEEFLEERNSAPSASYGVSYAAISTTPPRDFRVRYTDPGTPAAAEVGGLVNFIRGAQILTVDGVDLVNANSEADVDALNAGLFPETAGETHIFEVLDPGAVASRTVTLVSENLTSDPVNTVEVISTGTGNVGYILFNTFSPFASEAEIVDAIQQLQAANVTDLVLDLRYNGGGLLAIASQLSYMIAGPSFTAGRTFEDLRFNDDAGGLNPVTGETNNAVPFVDTTLGFSVVAGAPLPVLNINRVFVLSTENTCSASESVINSLRGVDFEVVLIGDVTCGKPYGFYPTDNCGETYYTIQFQGVNDKGFGAYADGFVPSNNSFPFGVSVNGCTVADDLDNALGDESEALLAAALSYRDTGTCPVITSSIVAESKTLSSGGPALSLPVSIPATNRDMRLPEGSL
ncbi:MAG: S41 family peptidase [Pseudomonadota bacterium]